MAPKLSNFSLVSNDTDDDLATTRVPNPPTVGKGLTQLVAMQLSDEDRATAQRVLTGKYDCMTSPVFNDPDEVEKLMSGTNRVPQVDIGWYVPVLERFNDAMPTTLTNTLFTSAQERTIFQQYNYCRHRVMTYRQAHQRKALSLKAVKDMLTWHAKAQDYRSQIAGGNLALVLAMIKRMRLNDFDFADLISEGNLALLRAIDKFDVARGFKFSTYACRAIIKAFSRFASRRGRQRQYFPVEFDPEMEKSDQVERKNEQAELESVEELRQIIRTNAADLSPMEQQILAQRFAVIMPAVSDAPGGNSEFFATHQARPLTLNQVGDLIGLTKERVRQIQNKAMEKLRLALAQRAMV